ncbi:MAG: lysophospholipase [Anaerolineae bacterium]
MESASFTTPDGVQIHTKFWQATSTSERIVLIVHGLAEHSGRYQHVAERLTQAGYHVYALDHRGHGQSTGERLHVPKPDSFITDLKQFYERIRLAHPNAAFFMLGHSMGSVISLDFILTYPDAISAIAVTGTATDVSTTVSPLLRGFSQVVYALFPQAPISAPSGTSVLTRDPEMLRLAENDPLLYKGWTKTSVAKYVVETGEHIQERADKITIPILIMHGEDDTLTPISGSKIMYGRVGSSDKTLKIWPNMFHEILNEVEREAVIDTLVTWLDQH